MSKASFINKTQQCFAVKGQVRRPHVPTSQTCSIWKCC